MQEYLDRHSPQDVTDVHRDIAETYVDDFAKYAGGSELLRLQKVFRMIPRVVGQKVKYSNILPDQQARETRTTIDLLSKARVCHRVLHSSCNGIPLYADTDERVYKLLSLDVGLMNFLCGVDWSAIAAIPETRLTNEGALAEQFVGQHLAPMTRPEPMHLTYWLRQGKSSNAEVDFVCSFGERIVPIEVKSGKSGSLKSLQQFVYAKQCPLAVRFDLNPPSLLESVHETRTPQGVKEVRFALLSLPVYAVELLPELLPTVG